MKIRKAIAPFLIAILLAGCVPEQTEHDFETAIEQGGSYERDVEANNKETEKDDVENAESDLEDEMLKILSTYKVSAESDNFDEDLNEIVDKTHQLGGYVSSNEVETKNAELSSSYMESKLTLRVPKQNVIQLAEEIKDIVYVKVKSLYSIDVTDKYYDIDAKIKGLEVREKRLHELYADAIQIEEIIEIEEELARIENKKEEEVRNKTKIEDRIKFSSIEVNLKEVKQIRQNETENMSSGEKIIYAFKSTSSSVAMIAIGTLIFLMKSLPVVILLLIIIFLYRKYIAKYVKRAIEIANDKDKKDDKDNYDL